MLWQKSLSYHNKSGFMLLSTVISIRILSWWLGESVTRCAVSFPGYKTSLLHRSIIRTINVMMRAKNVILFCMCACVVVFSVRITGYSSIDTINLVYGVLSATFCTPTGSKIKQTQSCDVFLQLWLAAEWFSRLWLVGDHRFLPTMAWVVVGYAAAWRYWGRGPFFPINVRDAINCKDNWWVNLLMLHNIVRVNKLVGDTVVTLCWRRRGNDKLDLVYYTHLWYVPLFTRTYTSITCDTPITLPVTCHVCDSVYCGPGSSRCYFSSKSSHSSFFCHCLCKSTLTYDVIPWKIALK